MKTRRLRKFKIICVRNYGMQHRSSRDNFRGRNFRCMLRLATALDVILLIQTANVAPLVEGSHAENVSSPR